MTLLTFKEFLDFSNSADQETVHTIAVLSESHPLLKNNPTIQRILNDRSAKVSLSELARVLQTILQKSVAIAQAAPGIPDGQRYLIIAEQNVLGISASVLSAAISARLQNSIERLSHIARGTSLRK